MLAGCGFQHFRILTVTRYVEHKHAMQCLRTTAKRHYDQHDMYPGITCQRVVNTNISLGSLYAHTLRAYYHASIRSSIVTITVHSDPSPPDFARRSPIIAEQHRAHLSSELCSRETVQKYVAAVVQIENRLRDV